MYFVEDKPSLVEGTPFPDMFEKGKSCKFGRYLFQGDIIEYVEGETNFFNKQEGAVGYLVLSNSCDLQNENKSLRPILLAPIYPFDHARVAEKDTYQGLIHETQYDKKDTFFISPLEQFGDKPLLAFIADIKSIRYNIIFDWNKISETAHGLDNKKLEYLFRIFHIDPAERINIEKIDDNEAIIVLTDNNSILIRLNDKRTTAIFEFHKGRTVELIAKKDNEKLNVDFRFDKYLLNYRLCSMKPPWREQLGYRVGNLFNRVSTYTPTKGELKSWTEIYKKTNSELPARIR